MYRLGVAYFKTRKLVVVKSNFDLLLSSTGSFLKEMQRFVEIFEFQHRNIEPKG